MSLFAVECNAALILLRFTEVCLVQSIVDGSLLEAKRLTCSKDLVS